METTNGGILEFWQVFMDLGGRLLLTLLLITIILLLILEIINGYSKNYRNGRKVSKSNKRWINAGVKRRTKFDGLEILEVNPQRISARFDTQQTRPAYTKESFPIIIRDEPRRDDGVVVDIKSGTIQRVRLSKDELPKTANSFEPSTLSFNK